MNDQSKALRLAERIEQMMSEGWATQSEADAAAELRRLHELYEQSRDKAVRMIEANDQWAAKTQWVQDTVQPEELGMHRADVLKQRIGRLVNTLAEAHTTYLAKLLADEALLRQCWDALDELMHSNSTKAAQHKYLAVTDAMRERLGESA